MELKDISGFQLCHLDETKSGAILREQRITQNMTQQQVASRAAISLQQYQKFESDARNIRTASFQLACRVLRALNMDIEKFFDGGYCFGEQVCMGGKGRLRYSKTGRDVADDVAE